MRFSIYPWDLKSWRSAFRIAGLPGVALFCLLLGAILQVADTTGGGAGHSSAKLIILVRTPATVIAFLLLLYRPKFAKVRLTELRFAYAAFALLYLVSSLWSEQRIQTIGKGAELVLAGLVFFQVSSSKNPLERVEALRQIILLTIATLAIYYCYRLSSAPSCVHSTSPGTAQQHDCTGSFPFWKWARLRRQCTISRRTGRMASASNHVRTAVRQMAFALALFSVSASRTSFGILLLTMLIVVFKKSKILASLAIGSVVAGTIFWSAIVARLQGHQASSDFVTLSGRTVVWTAAVRQFEAHPVLGVGGGIGGKVVIAHIGNMYLEQMSSLHNGFLEVLTGLGLVGFLLGTYLLILATWRAWTAWNEHPEYAGTYVLIVHVWMTTIMSTGILGWMGFELALFLCIVTNLDLVRQRSRATVMIPVPVRWPSLPVRAEEQQVN